jgi:S1-C subfamily serine protease
LKLPPLTIVPKDDNQQEVHMRRSATALVLAMVLTLLLAACTSTPEPAAPRQATTASAGSPVQAAASGSLPDLVQRVEPSVVTVQVSGGEGSGVVWNADGTIVTNNHVVAGQQAARIVFADGSRVTGRVQATDPRNDLAIVKAARTGLPAATFADRIPRVGELAVAMGNPLGFENSVTAGIVSGLNRNIPGSAQTGDQSLVDLLQTDAAISPGNSGGALVGADGKVIGINVAYIPPSEGSVSLGFAIPSPRVIDVVEQLLEDGTVDYTWLGVAYAPLTPEIAQQFGINAESGVVVESVDPGGPAARAGLQPGDVIIAVEGKALENAEQLLGAIRARKPGDPLPLRVLRGGKELDITVTLGEQPEGK